MAKQIEPPEGFGIYLHWPFCEAKCPYCDFNSYVSPQIDPGDWQRAFLCELERYSREVPSRTVNSVFFGGGTPSLMPVGMVGAILDKIARLWPVAPDVEVTLEANPSSAEAEKFLGFRQAGVNRVSVGVQALNDGDLKRLGRLHSAAEARQAADMALSIFDRASFDLIYARQDQALASWEAELKEALTWGFSHVSAYSLTIEAGTAFGALHKVGKLRGLPDGDLSAEMYDITRNLCAQAGLDQYEVSNYAAPGQMSRHNLIYWNCGDYLGIGPGAHGRLTLSDGGRVATETRLMPGPWLENALDTSGESKRELLDPRAQAMELLVMGLRVREGVDLARLKDRCGWAPNHAVVEDLARMGIVEQSGHRLSVTADYMGVLNRVIEELSEGI